MTAYLSAHPLLWLVAIAFLGLFILRMVARLACLATLVIAVLIGLSALGGIFGRII